MVDMCYDPGALHSAGERHEKLAADIEPIIDQLARLTVDGGALGLRPLAARFAAALEHARLGCSTALAREADARSEQSCRTTTTAAMGGLLTETTAGTALGAMAVDPTRPDTSSAVGPGFTPGSILSGMG